jgi:hypothetical protein
MINLNDHVNFAKHIFTTYSYINSLFTFFHPLMKKCHCGTKSFEIFERIFVKMSI